MSKFFLDNLILVVLYPLWISILLFAGRFFAVKMSKAIIVSLTVLGSFLGIVFSFGAIPIVFSTEVLPSNIFNFIKINDFVLNLGFSPDKLSIVALCLLYIVSFFVQLFSVSYMRYETRFYRFFAYLNFFNFAMGALFLASNLFQMYIMWELIGLISYLYVGFKYTNPLKSFASLKVFLINRVGDVAFLAGLVCLAYIMTAYSTPQFVTLDFSDFNFISAVVYAHTNPTTFLMLCLMFLFAAFVKSAQFPFHPWLLAAMKAPTPVSALIHSSTLVVAGIFLVLRLQPLLSLSATVMTIISIVGAITALYASLCAICQTNVKKVLAYSTSANIGLMFVAIGFGNLDLAMAYMLVHGLLKASMFLSYGMLNNEYLENKTIKLPFLFVFSGILLAGLIFAPLNLKEMLYEMLKGNFYFNLSFLLVCLMSAIYIARLCTLYFPTKQQRGNICESLSIYGLLFIVLLLTPYIANKGIGLPFFCSLLGGVSSVFITLKNRKSCEVGFVYTTVSRGFYLDRLYYVIIPNAYTKLTSFCNRIDDFFSNNKILYNISQILVRISAGIEKKVFDMSGRLISYCVKFASLEMEIVQTKNVQTYIAYGVLIVVSILVTILLAYMFIINNLGGVK